MTRLACGQANPADARFCGGRLELVCAACQATNPGGNRFCHQCGGPQGERKQVTCPVIRELEQLAGGPS